MSRRIFGIETEFGCLIKGDAFRTAEEGSVRIKDYVFDELSLGIADMHYRDWGSHHLMEVFFIMGVGFIWIWDIWSMLALSV